MNGQEKKFDLKKFFDENKGKIAMAGCVMAAGVFGVALGYGIRNERIYKELGLMKTEKNKKALLGFAEMIRRGDAVSFHIMSEDKMIPLSELPKLATEVSERTIEKFGDAKVVGLYVTEKMLTE